MKTLALALALLAILTAATAQPIWQGEVAAPTRPQSPCLADFTGANNVYAQNWREYGLGWSRHDFVWDKVEPEDGRFEEAVIRARTFTSPIVG